MQLAAFIVAILLIALLMTDTPYFFRYRSIRFLYRSGLLLFSRVFKTNPKVYNSNIPRWKIEHWMAQAGFSLPIAEEDGERRYLLTEFIPTFSYPIPLLMRAKVYWDNAENNVIVRGYATWTYFLILVVLIALFFIPTQGQEYICFSAFLIMYLLWSIAVYISQQQRLYSLGIKVAEYLSAGESNSATENDALARKAG
jgi:hypothetical protein